MLQFTGDNLLARNNLKYLLLLACAIFSFVNQQVCLAQDTVKNNTAKQALTTVSGTVTDAANGEPIANVNVKLSGSNTGTTTNQSGEFSLSASGAYRSVRFASVGYLAQTRSIKAGQANVLNIRLHTSQTQLTEVTVTAGTHKRYRNKDNPAVELIRKVIEHKDENRPQGADYLQYDQYERIGLSFYHLSPKFINGGFFSKYKFLLDTGMVINGLPQTALPVYFSEKLSQYYYRKNPEKTISILTAQKQVNIIKFLDTVGIDIYMNRLYGDNIDIYENNIFILTSQFLSPIANHSPDFYKFFIVDTIQTAKGKLIELSFTPRNKGDLLFEGKILVTLDGHYAVKSCELDINKQINVNFLRTLKVNLEFTPFNGGRYYLSKSDVKADFGISKTRATAVFGERTVFHTNYKLNTPLDQKFYLGKSSQTLPNPNEADTGYWAKHRTDTLPSQQAQIYAHISKLEGMRSFKRTTWIASTLVDGYAKLGPVQLGPTGAFYAFDYVEGSRFQLGGRTTPTFNKSIYLEGYAAYATRSKKLEGEFSTYFSLNKTPFYKYPNDFFRVSYLYDVNVPGFSYAITNQEQALSSIHTGTSDYFVYSKIFSVDYVKDLENHISFDVTLRNWDQQAAGTLLYLRNDAANTQVDNLTTTEAGFRIRYAPHEQIIQGAQYRHTIYSKYPILNFQVTHDFKNVLNGSYSCTDFSANVAKRFYFSQLGYGDATLLGNYLRGKVPFPLLNIPQANQSLAYLPDNYNAMDYLEFVSDHYVGFNFTQSFNGFFLNKIPLVDRLKWREFLSFKVLYGGLRNENNPLYSKGLYDLPAAFSGQNGTFALGNTPYIEGGVGIGNIFKIIRVDLIRRFDYLDHPGISTYVIKFSFTPDL